MRFALSGYREQINQLTSFLDASMLYGSSKNEENAVRAFKDGALKFEPDEGEGATCNAASSSTSSDKFCFLPRFTNADGETKIFAGLYYISS